MSRILVDGMYEAQNLYILRYAEGPKMGQVFQEIKLYSKFGIGSNDWGYFVTQTSENGSGRLQVHQLISKDILTLPADELDLYFGERKGLPLRHRAKLLWAMDKDSARRCLYREPIDDTEPNLYKKVFAFLDLNLDEAAAGPMLIKADELDGYYQALLSKEKAVEWIQKNYTCIDPTITHAKFQYKKKPISDEVVMVTTDNDAKPEIIAGHQFDNSAWSPIEGLIRIHGLDALGDFAQGLQRSWEILTNQNEAKAFIKENEIVNINQDAAFYIFKGDKQLFITYETGMTNYSECSQEEQFIFKVFETYKNQPEVWA